MRSFLVSALAALALSLLVPAMAPAEGTTPTTSGAAATSHGVVNMSVAINHFYATAAGTKASGTASATLTPHGGSPLTVKKRVTLAAATSGSCRILTLTLEKLELKLLGLEVSLEGNMPGEKIELILTGEPHGGVLGSLFCALANAKVNLGQTGAAARLQRAIARKLNRAIARHGPIRPLAFRAQVPAKTAAVPPEGSCPVLSLVLGPLHLNLLGLVVDLNQIHLMLNADPNGGVLGSLFCGLANTKLAGPAGP